MQWDPNGGLDCLLLLMAPYLVHREPLSLKPLCQSFDNGWNATSIFLMEFYPILPGRCSTPKISAANNGCQIQILWLFWFMMMTGNALPFGWARKRSTEIPCSKPMYNSCIYQASSATGYFGVLAQSALDGQDWIARHSYRLAGIAYPNLA